MSYISDILSLITEPWVLLILIASFMFAIGNYIDELLLVKYEQPVGTLVIMSGLFGVVLMLFFIILSITTDTDVLLPTSVMLVALLVGVLELLWVIPYLYATERRGAMIAGPLFQIVPVIALGLEALTGIIPPFIQIIGALLIVTGGVILSVEQEESEEGVKNHKIDWQTVVLMSLSAFLVALIYVLFKGAAGTSSYIAVGFWSGAGMAFSGIFLWLFYKPYQSDFNTFLKNSDRKAIGIQLFNELMDSGGAYLTHLANILGPSVLLVTAFNATQPLAIGILGILLTMIGVKHTGSTSGSLWKITLVSILLITCGTMVIAFK